MSGQTAGQLWALSDREREASHLSNCTIGRAPSPSLASRAPQSISSRAARVPARRAAACPLRLARGSQLGAELRPSMRSKLRSLTKTSKRSCARFLAARGHPRTTTMPSSSSMRRSTRSAAPTFMTILWTTGKAYSSCQRGSHKLSRKTAMMFSIRSQGLPRLRRQTRDHQ